MRFDLDFGSGVKGEFIGWAPDRELNPQYDGIPDVERFGLVIQHPHGETGEPHVSMITFDGYVQRKVTPGRPMWQVISWEPLTLSPSILCDCTLHGFIENGAWRSV